MELSTKIPSELQDAIRIFDYESDIVDVLELVEDMPHEDFWRVFASEFLKCETIHPQRDRIISLLKQNQPQKMYFDEDVEFAKTLPETLTIYRGADLYKKMGICWTLERENALNYARIVDFRDGDNPVIFECKVPKKSVLFVANRDGRSTIIVDPSMLSDFTTTHCNF